ncbi:hypothetical protein VDGD_02946 [Verticillium dahliae]|nr:hypothetical protein VDGD_02946 [Verticillium dahliae]
MEHPFSTSKVTVEYFDPHGVYKLLGPGLVPRLPLRNLHWQSHAGPLRSIDVLFVELVDTGADPAAAAPRATLRRSVSAGVQDDGFQTQQLGRKSASTDNIEAPAAAAQQPGKERRHQIPGLRRTPYLKVLLVRCDDNDTYKATTRAEIRDWIKLHTPPSQSTRKANNQENHDAFEWLIVHVVVPNTVAATQPRTSGKSAEGASSDKTASSRWRTGSSTLLEKMRADFNVTGKGAVDRIAQIRIGINDVPYDILPRVVPATPTGYSETEKDAEVAWQELLSKIKGLILASFDMRVTQYEDDIREKDAQRLLPGWNFCTFFILKEGLARGFESVGLIEDALVGYDELSVGLDSVIHEQVATGDAERNGGALLGYTAELKKQAEQAVAAATGAGNLEDEESVDLQSKELPAASHFDEIPISSTKKLYRDMIVANNVSVFDFRCYIFGRQLALLLRSGNAWSSREELLVKLKEQQESVLHGVAPQAPAPKQAEDAENLTMLAEICRRTLQFIPAISQIMRADITSAVSQSRSDSADHSVSPVVTEVIDNLVASFAFSVAQQILAQTSTKSLPIPPSLLITPEIHEPKVSIPEPKTMMHPARTTSLSVRTTTAAPHSPGIFPGPGAGQRASASESMSVAPTNQFLKNGLEDLAARRAELYNLSRNVLEECGKKRGWGDGWASVPDVENSGNETMEDISLDDNEPPTKKAQAEVPQQPLLSGIEGRLLQAALDNQGDFYRLYETLTDKALRHYTVADHNYAVQASMTDLAVLKYHLGDCSAAASYFYRVTPFYGETGWSVLELSMLVMYAHCLHELQRKDEYVRVVLKLLTKAAAAEKDRLARRKGFRLGAGHDVEHASFAAIRGFVGKLLAVTKTFSNEVPVPLGHVFTNPQLDESPEYDVGLDSFSLTIKLSSLLVDDLTIETARMRLTSSDPGVPKELWLESTTPQVLKRGESTIRLHSKTSVSGRYDVDRLSLTSSNIHLHYERDIDHDSSKGAEAFFLPKVTVCRQEGGLDCQLTAARHTQLDRNNCLDLKLLTGWNNVTSCEIRVRPSTGGLRLLSTEAQFIGPNFEFAGALEPGLFRFSALEPDTSVQLRFPFSTEQDVANISVKVDVIYSTEKGTYTFSAIPTIPISLALGVNVQDVFKHNAIFSRFSVSTASPSPITVYKSELQQSDIFESHFGVAPSKPVVVFPKQPASLLYKITRKKGVAVQPKTQKTLYLKVFYSVVLEQIVATVSRLVKQAVVGSDLARYATLVEAQLQKQVPGALSLFDLERAGLLGEISTSFLAKPAVDGSFRGLGKLPGSDKDAARAIASFIQDWQQKNPKLPLKSSENIEDAQSILIPVDVPSIPILFTIDIQLDESLPSPVPRKDAGTPITGINQLLSANLTLKWTRRWDTSPGVTDSSAAPQEFIYDVTAAPDTWLLGGRKRGRVKVPAPGTDSSTPDQSVVNIPLIMVPLREGWLPYPSVDMREAKAEEDGLPPTQGHCETDFRNLGETVRVIADREKVTLSLDSSGPGGGPLVVESERRVLEGRIVV